MNYCFNEWRLKTILLHRKNNQISEKISIALVFIDQIVNKTCSADNA